MPVVRTREGIEVVTRTVGGREIIESFNVRLYKQLANATMMQLRVIAEESRELILDKVYAGPVARGHPGTPEVERPPVLRRKRIGRVDRRPFRHRALAASTVRKKAAAEQDGRKLIAEGDYTYGIEVIRGKRRGKTAYYTVRPKPGLHPRAGVTHRILAAWLEFGTKNMPPRKHWAPVLRIVKRMLRQTVPGVRAVALRTTIRQVR